MWVFMSCVFNFCLTNIFFLYIKNEGLGFLFFSGIIIYGYIHITETKQVKCFEKDHFTNLIAKFISGLHFMFE